MLFKDFDALFKKQALAVSFDQGLDLALMVCKKLYFNYEAFSTEENWGDKDLLMEAIRSCEMFRSKNIDQKGLSALLTAVELITPDTNDFGTFRGTCALYASAAVYYTLKFILDKNGIHVYNVGECYFNTVDLQIWENEDENDNLPEEFIDEHPMMVEARTLLLNLTK